ncbi:MAG TPA: OST-HTH/LOTUS domain-containing protein, partial [Vicinamibacterales bacterium]|nr:OST-HTH/LOTUS domain-containing protein [Vicinamibacterales bacterium]
EKLKQYDKKIFVVGGRQFTSQIMQKNCHEFIAYENLASVGGGGGGRRASGPQAKGERTSIEQAIPLVKRAMKVLSERDVEPQLGLFKSTLLQLDSTFSERNYGAGSFRDFAQKLEKAGVLTVEHTQSGWVVGPANGGAPEATAVSEEPEQAAPAASKAEDAKPDEAKPDGAKPNDAKPAKRGNAADGVREFASVLASAEIRKWPLYLRNVKQIIRQQGQGFDERAYGFANLADLLRAAHRENVVRVDRDRQGVIRVFQASVVPGTAVKAKPASDVYDVENDPNLAEDLARAHGLVPAPAEVTEPVAGPPSEPDAVAGAQTDDVAADAAAAEAEPPKKKATSRRKRAPASATPTARKTAKPRKPRKAAAAKA